MKQLELNKAESGPEESKEEPIEEAKEEGTVDEVGRATLLKLFADIRQ